MNEIKGLIFDIQRSSFVDGPGIRTTVFFKGCNLRCVWCHNPEGYAPKPEIMFFKDKCTGCGSCRDVCPTALESCTLCGKCSEVCESGARKICGKEYTTDELIKEILKDKMFYESSSGGVTFSGGECMLQIDFLEAILKKCRENKIHTAIDTAGCVPREYFERILPYTDMFLYDVKAIDGELHKHCTGQSNRLILDNLLFLDSCGKDMEIRIPYVPGINSGEIEKIAEFLERLNDKTKVSVLPYHSHADTKYAALGINNTLSKRLPKESEIEAAKKLLASHGISVI